MILPILPSLVSPGVWTHPAHRLVSHIRRGLLEAEINQEIPMHTQKERTQGYLGGMGKVQTAPAAQEDPIPAGASHSSRVGT